MWVRGAIKETITCGPSKSNRFTCIPEKIWTASIRVTGKNHIAFAWDLFAAVGDKSEFWRYKFIESFEFRKEHGVFDEYVVL